MSSSFLAVVLLETPVIPDMSALAKAIRARHPELPIEADGGKEGQTSPLLRCGDDTVAVMSMPSPAPADPGLWLRTSATWPQGEAIAARHRGHVIVSVLGKKHEPLRAARLTTAVVGGLIAAVPQCCAVLWNGKVARATDLWSDMSKQSFAPFPEYPFSLWIDVLPFRSDSGIGAVTMGLSAFAEREIEFETHKLSLAELMDKVHGLAVYLVEHGPVVKDGDTFGSNERERFTVYYKNSDTFGGLPVFYCTDDPAK
ncbi:DUF4261 domain-containing protein [Bradyrhizobium sp.]|uniref:DUF4261 domain-containing protein n=1 Tax=Bradyrhizobium sp. TaxID=376 RepID=UPI0039E65235